MSWISAWNFFIENFKATGDTDKSLSDKTLKRNWHERIKCSIIGS